MSTPLHIADSGLMDYRAAWDLQLALHARVLSGEFPAGALILVEHPPIITIGRHPGSARHLLASPELLQARGVQVIETDRGGDITFHGPGQLVAYPILPLNTYNLNLHAYMRLLEDIVIATLAPFGITALRSPGATGVWVHPPHSALSTQHPALPTPPSALGPQHSALEKLCAMGVKLRRWVSLHGLALNVDVDLTFFDLINPCGLSRPVTSLQKLLGPAAPDMPACKVALTHAFQTHLQTPAASA